MGKTEDPVVHLQRALADDAFTLHCQPVAALGTGLASYPFGEILIRLREEEEALLPPGDFLPVLEHYGLMPQLDRWVVHQVLRRASRGMRLPAFSINVGAQTLADPLFASFVAEALYVAQAGGTCLLFEIDEYDALAAPQCTARFAALAGSVGAGIVLDGFGRAAAGVSLLELPCVRLAKLHHSVTRRLAAGGAPSGAFLRLREAAAARGVDLVAECVEERETFRRLRAHGVAYAQGFAVYAPRPLDDFVEPALREVA